MMEIKDLIIKQKKDYYILDFKMTFESEDDELVEWTNNWTTLYCQNGNWYFNHVVYRIDKDKDEALKKFWGKEKNVFKTPEPFLYYDLENMAEIINLLFSERQVQELISQKALTFNKKQLFHKKAIVKRLQNLKSCMIHAYNNEEHIGIIGPNAEYYIPLSAIEIGTHITDDLPNGDLYGEQENGEELIRDLILACKNEQIYKRYSFIWHRISKDGQKNNFNECGHLHFAWELEEEALFFDELFYSDCMVKIADEYIFQQNNDNLINIFRRNDEDGYIDIPYDGFDLMDMIIWDEEDIFSSHLSELKFNKKNFIRTIAKDYKIISYEQYLNEEDL